MKIDLDFILEHTAHLWEEVRHKRIFITGGTGFMGCWLLESFLHANAELKLNASIYVLSRNPEAFRLKAQHLFSNPCLTMHRGDLASFVYPEGEFQYVIHAATATENGECTASAASQFYLNLLGTRRILEFAGCCSAEKLLYTSSGAVYGKQPPDMPRIPEEYMGAPDTVDEKSAYGEGKRASEFLCAMHGKHHGFEAKIARGFAFVGPYLPIDLNFAIGNFIADTLNNQPIHIQGDGTPLRSYLYAADMTIWLWTILFNGISNRPYNVGSENGITILDLAKRVANASEKNLGIITAYEPLPDRKPERYLPSVERAGRELGMHQHINLEDAIKRTLAWYARRTD